MKLTKNQVDRLMSMDDWVDNLDGVCKMLNSWGIDIVEWDVPWFMEVFLLQEHRRYDLDQIVTPVKNEVVPKIGNMYHLTWAHRGCVWKLRRLLPNGRCELITPKTKKKLEANTADLIICKK